MVNSLFCPNQIRVNGISLCDDTIDKYRDLGMMCFDIERQEEVFIKFDLFGFFSGFKSRVPTDKEMNECKCISLTSEHTWNPSKFDSRHHLKYVSSANSFKTVSHIMDDIVTSISSSNGPSTLKKHLVTNDHDYLKNISAIKATSRNARIGPEQLIAKWRISIESAKKTLS